MNLPTPQEFQSQALAWITVTGIVATAALAAYAAIKSKINEVQSTNLKERLDIQRGNIDANAESIKTVLLATPAPASNSIQKVDVVNTEKNPVITEDVKL